MEFSDECLTLKARGLKRGEEMEFNGGGLLFLIVKSGAGACQCMRTQHRLGAGDVLVANSAYRGKVLAGENEEMAFWFFVAECEHLFPLFSGREICLLRNVTEGFISGRVYAASTPLARECVRLTEEAPAEASLDHRVHVLRIVSAILTGEFDAAQPRLSCFVPAQNQVVQMFEGLRTTELLSLSVGDLAKKFNCSRRHLNRLFHKHWGLSVASLQMEMRLLKAASLLMDPHAKIYSVAAQCGFNHVGPFNTCFKRRFGASPSLWRTGGVNGEKLDSARKPGRQPCPVRANGVCPWHKGGVADFAVVQECTSEWKG